MRVLFVDQFSELGGAQLVLRDVMAEALSRGWHAEFMAPGNGGLFEFCTTVGIPSYHLPIGHYTNGSKSIREAFRYGIDITRTAKAVRKVFSQKQMDLVVANGPRIMPAVAHARVPAVFHLHSRLDKQYARAALRWAHWRSGATVVCCSNFVAAALTHIPSRVIYNGVGDCGYKSYRVRKSDPRIAIIGRISPEKGHPDFIRAAAIVTRFWPKARFSIYGESLFSDRSFETRLRAMTPPGTVEFHGWTDDVAGVLHETDILAVPSTAVEATPRVIPEALSAGTPVIAYPSGGIPELIAHGDTGLLTARPDYKSLAQSIERLLSDTPLRVRLARNGRREWESRFGLDRFQRDVCDLLERSAEERGQPQSTAAVACKNDLA
jgi:glycosyltransferase involved in cell wall biosynthesis